MKLPKKDFKIKIHPLTFKVTYEKELKTSKGNRGNGHIHMIKQHVRLADDLTEERKKMVFIHEVLHGLIRLTSLNVTMKQGIGEEELVARLAPALYGFIEDNKELFK